MDIRKKNRAEAPNPTPSTEFSDKHQEKDMHVDLHQNLTEEMAALSKEVESLKEKLLLCQADEENLRKRMQKELEETKKYSVADFAKVMLEPLEDLFRTIENLDTKKRSNGEDVSPFVKGIEMIKSNMIKGFEQFGIKRIFPLNEAFDHSMHQAISQIPDSSKDENTVVNVVQAGYMIKDRLLRPAMVIVTKKE